MCVLNKCSYFKIIDKFNWNSFSQYELLLILMRNKSIFLRRHQNAKRTMKKIINFGFAVKSNEKLFYRILFPVFSLSIFPDGMKSRAIFSAQNVMQNMK